MTIQPLATPPDDEERDIGTALIDRLAAHVKRQAQQVLPGREQRFRSIAANYAHLGAVADELLGHALRDVEQTPDYFAAVTRFGLTQAIQDDEPSEEQPTIIEGKVVKKEPAEGVDHEQQEQ